MSAEILFTRQANKKIEPISTERRKTFNHTTNRPEGEKYFDLERTTNNHNEGRSYQDETNTTQNILIAPPIPIPPNIDRIPSVPKKISSVQKYITSLDYNHTTLKFVTLRRDRGTNHLVRMAKRIIKDSLPIRCVEGVFLGVYLTNAVAEEILRIPVSFKSRMMGGGEHGHLVLLVRHKRKWGAIGMSRIKTLMYKELKYDCLFSLLTEFRRSYEDCCHDVIYLSLGLPFLQQAAADRPIQWSVLRLNNLDDGGAKWSSIEEILRQYETDCVAIVEYYVKNGILPDCCHDYKQGKIGGGKKRGRRRIDLK